MGADMLAKHLTGNVRTAAFTQALRPFRPARPIQRTMASAAAEKVVFWDILPAPGGCEITYLISKYIEAAQGFRHR